jgi:hypothetical protein
MQGTGVRVDGDYYWVAWRWLSEYTNRVECTSISASCPWNQAVGWARIQDLTHSRCSHRRVCYGGSMNAIEIVRESVPVPSQRRVEDIDQQEHVVVVRVSSTQPPRCPACTSVRVSYHSRYDRCAATRPGGGRAGHHQSVEQRAG